MVERKEKLKFNEFSLSRDSLMIYVWLSKVIHFACGKAER